LIFQLRWAKNGRGSPSKCATGFKTNLPNVLRSVQVEICRIKLPECLPFQNVASLEYNSLLCFNIPPKERPKASPCLSR
jgi:hypothetical protein